MKRVERPGSGDRPAMSSALLGNNPGAQASRSPAGDLTAFIEVDMGSRCVPLRFLCE